ncbi:MAG TPA: ABC transporter permease [Bryobacteraceae bacterium]|jgi:predicted permease
MAWWDFLRRDKADREWREEMESHLQISIDAFMAEGMSAEDARSAALVRAGNMTARREEIYRMNGIAVVDSIVGDVRYAIRGLRHNPGFTVVAILTLALGIGANTAVFSVVDGVLLKPLPYPHSEDLIALAQVAPGAGGLIAGSHGLALSSSMYFTYSEQNRSFQTMGVWTGVDVTVSGMAEPEQVPAVLASDGFLQALAIRPEVGRWLLAGDQVPGAAETIVLSYGYWQRKFGGDTSVIGKKVFVDGRPRQVVGVMPASFQIVGTRADLILPLQLDRRHATLPGFYLNGLGRLKPGVSLELANADIARLLPIWMTSWPLSDGGKTGDALAQTVYRAWRIGPNLRPLRDVVVGNVGSVLWVIMGTLGMVMLIACANVANLLLVRTDSRQQELAIRAALGAGWGRIVRQLLMESLLLALAGGAAGVVVAYEGLRFLIHNGPSNLPRLNEITLDSSALAFTFAVALLSGLVFGLIPALKYAGPNVSGSLRGGGRTMSDSGDRQRARNTLVVVQVALALVLLISSGLMIRTFSAMRNVDPGVSQLDQLQIFRVSIPSAIEPSDERATRMENSIADKLAAIPGVRAVGFGTAMPLDEAPPDWDGVLIEGQSYATGSRPPMRLFRNVSPEFFSALGARIVAGRELTWTDIYGKRMYVLVSENLARELWGSPAAAIGKRIRTGDASAWREVVGVAADIRHMGVQEGAPPTVYWPVYGQVPYAGYMLASRNVAYAVRTDRAGTGPLLNEIRQAVWSVNGALPVAQTETMREVFDRSMARTAFTLVMLGIAGSMALVLGLIGIYGVIAYAVSQRTREIGIRLAMGAEPGQVRRMFVRYGLRLGAVGMVVGVAAALGLSRSMKSLLFGVAAVDPVTFAVVPLLLLAAVAAACYVPARRASNVDPVEAMRVK